MRPKSIAILILSLLAYLPLNAQLPPKGERTLHIICTGDVHGSWFDEPYVGFKTRTSLMSVKHYVDSVRQAVGDYSVMLLDAGDCLQGDNAAYAFNYEVPDISHCYARMAAYMGYDAIVVGNHDMETGHEVYDRVNYELGRFGIPWLAGNYLFEQTGKPYFPAYKIFDRCGLKVAVLGFGNPNLAEWLDDELWSGIKLESLIPCVQKWVDEVRAAESPDVVIVVVHSGTGEGDGSQYESQGLDLYNSLSGVDLLITGHDHRPVAINGENGFSLVNSGSRAGYVGHSEITVKGRSGKLTSKSVSARTVRLDKKAVDEKMKEVFKADFDYVKRFTLQKVGKLAMPLHTRESYIGMCDYINFIHTVQLDASKAQISFAAPLTFDGNVAAGEVLYNDLFTIYPYENQLYVVRLTGAEIKAAMEYVYGGWTSVPGEHVLNISDRADPRTGSPRWSFNSRSYNFDSVAGIVYTVDVTKPEGRKINIQGLADGTPFDPAASYDVAVTSYRASGGGNILTEGAGIPKDELKSRVVARYPQIRDLVRRYLEKKGTVDAGMVGDRAVLGSWSFVPEDVAGPMLKNDLELIFRH